MTKYLNILLGFLLYCASASMSSATFACPMKIDTEQKPQNKTLMFIQLMNWCANDLSCSKVYHQTPQHQNFTIFRHLVQSKLAGRYDLYKTIKYCK